MNRKNPKVDAFLGESRQWREESKQLRAIVLACGLTEELKWGKPCYTLEQRNIVIIQGFKEYCALLFCSGALLKDPKRLLTKPGEHTQAARQLRFTHVREVVGKAPIVKAYVREAIKAERAGLKVLFNKNPDPVPKELGAKLSEDPALDAAFKALTPGRQRAYILYFSGAKQSETREARVARCVQRILDGKGLNDFR
jgi:uncharacterized protein YdeI (YjbR/CyaY-like superfamily)